VRKKPVVLLVRRVIGDTSVWVLESEHSTNEDAERHWNSSIRGRGVTAWSWWGPRRIADKMLADPYFDPDSEAVPVG
jgi:hypothetical protein